MSRLPNVDGPSVTGTLKRQRDLQRKQGTASPFALTGQTATDYVASQVATANAYTDKATALYGMETSYAPLTIPVTTTTVVPWSAPTENVGGYVVSGGIVTVPAGLAGLYAITSTIQTAGSGQSVRAFSNMWAGARSQLRSVFTGDNIASISATVRLADLDTIRVEVYCGTATSLVNGWLTLYRLHA